ncbi:tRNA (5-methylaminomethyl-2-thiouridine)(34)-methyltransferase MnmD [Paracoccus sp. S-4012]|uniref:tRNA (5-methylaminomethyl-2-thiouridine)(34)-methyltransferase MnmD n=1 Tax=Paracoccus sp. S-4012 TaxID=2665648 RepID=UPI0012AF60B8|nr:tRNA (5-methylaminomethyl-2-thiouridine)(34)-methyltransferase MnmD [Paracoccus sp. S-4012]MRX49092.1 tRNA (5-methylaminomethyl-2-thiouridine)(34)-methyltransferase MnmD [Paracoccus sp. S-4012]
MTDPDQPLDWREGGVPVSRRFDDPYFSLAGGLAETRHVFLDGNGLPERLRPGFHVAELGFGTGLNLLALASITTVPIRFTSFEAFPLGERDLSRAHAAFPALAPLAAELRAGLATGTRFRVGEVEAEIIPGDARETLRLWPGRVDAWFLDGFSPAKNPELWGEALLAEVARHTAPGGSFATYTAAGHVRRALTAAGFAVERRPGFAGKRHMTAGRLPDIAAAGASRHIQG